MCHQILIWIQCFTYATGSPVLSPYSQNKTSIKSVLHQTAVISATIDAYPVPTSRNFSWMKREDNDALTKIQTNKSYIVHVDELQTDLIIKDVQSYNYGQYKLVVTNGVGEPLEVPFYLSESSESSLNKCFSIQNVCNRGQGQ